MASKDWRDHKNGMTVAERAAYVERDMWDEMKDITTLSTLVTFGQACAAAEKTRAVAEAQRGTVSSTFGELVMRWPQAAEKIESHAWDNMPIWEQRDWLIGQLAEAQRWRPVEELRAHKELYGQRRRSFFGDDEGFPIYGLEVTLKIKATKHYAAYVAGARYHNVSNRWHGVGDRCFDWNYIEGWLPLPPASEEGGK